MLPSKTKQICFPPDPPEMLESTGFCLGSIFCRELELGRCSGGGLRGECLTKSEPGKDSLGRSILRVVQIDKVLLQANGQEKKQLREMDENFSI